MPDTPKPVRAYAAWHPKPGIVVVFAVADEDTAFTYFHELFPSAKPSEFKKEGWRIIPVDVVPVKEEGK